MQRERDEVDLLHACTSAAIGRYQLSRSTAPTHCTRAAPELTIVVGQRRVRWVKRWATQKAFAPPAVARIAPAVEDVPVEHCHRVRSTSRGETNAPALLPR